MVAVVLKTQSAQELNAHDTFDATYKIVVVVVVVVVVVGGGGVVVSLRKVVGEGS